MPDFVFTIRTPAELDGLEQAVKGFEQLRNAAKAAGESTAEYDQKISSAKSAISAYGAEQSNLSNLVKTYSREEVDAITRSGIAHEEAVAPVNKLTVAKKDLKSIVKGLATEFPTLGYVARLALNPIAFAVTTIVSAFALWDFRIKELTKSLGGVKMPDIATSDVEKIDQLAAAYERAAVKFGSNKEAEDRNAAMTARYIADIQHQLTLTLALIEAQKNLDKARNPAPEAQAQIEKDAAEASRKAANDAKDKEIDAKIIEQKRLREIGKKKIADAGSPAPEDVDQDNLAKFKLLIEGGKDEDGEDQPGAVKNKADAKSRLKEIQNLRDMAQFDPRRIYYDNKFRARYGTDATYDDGEAMEKKRVQEADEQLASYEQFKRSMGRRAGKRELKKQGEQDIEDAAKMDEPIMRDIAANQREKAQRAEIERINAEAARVKAEAEAKKQAEQEERKRRRAGQAADGDVRNNRSGEVSTFTPTPIPDPTPEFVAYNNQILATLANLKQTIADAGSKLQDSNLS